jgi:hydroxypyruvate isomerase
MPIFAANLSFLFNERPFLDRFAAAAGAGFTAVEYLFPYDHPPEAIAERLEATGLTQALFNLPPGDWAKGERGLAALPERFAAVKAGLDSAWPYIEATGVKRVHLMAGIADPKDRQAHAAWRRSLHYVAGSLAERGVDLLIEPINGYDMPGYFLNDFAIAEAAIAELGLPNLKLQFDVYHRQILHGDVARALRRLMPVIGHVQIASAPSRNEPDGEELNYPFLFQVLDRLGYRGFVGCEYRPRGRTEDGLQWLTVEGERSWTDPA